MSDRKAVIKNADMNEEMQQDAVDFATQALEKFNIEKVTDTNKRVQISDGGANIEMGTRRKGWRGKGVLIGSKQRRRTGQ